MRSIISRTILVFVAAFIRKLRRRYRIVVLSLITALIFLCFPVNDNEDIDSRLIGYNGRYRRQYDQHTCQSMYDNFHIQNRTTQFSGRTTPTCKRAKIDPPNSCEFIQRKTATHTNKCANFNSFDFCKSSLYKNKTSQSFSYKFNCSFMLSYCLRTKYGGFSESKAEVIWNYFKADKTVEEQMSVISQNTDFIFLQCYMNKFWYYYYRINNYQFSEDGAAYQFLYFVGDKISRRRKVNSKFQNAYNDNKEIDDNKPNINIIFLDSISRTLFYYAMQNTVKTFKRAAESRKRLIFDFKLFQSVALSTDFHIDNFYLGDNFTEKPHESEFYFHNGWKFFSDLKRAGYKTGYSWDLCFGETWKSSKTRGQSQHHRLSTFNNLVSNMRLDDVGISKAVCDFMKLSIGKVDSFSKYQRCLNGKLFAEQQLYQLLEFQKYTTQNGHKFATYFDSNLNHNIKLSSIKNIDQKLSEYLKNILKMDDVLTILFSDHGNKLSLDYIIRNNPEASLDRWNPFLFIILPENEEMYFTREEIAALELNQHRLVTIRDLHHVVCKRRGGLLSEIPFDRSCKDIKYTSEFTMNMCICEGHQNNSVTQTETDHVIRTAERALNKLIPSNSTSICRKLKFKSTSEKSVTKYPVSPGVTGYSALLELENFEYQDSKVVFGVMIDFLEEQKVYSFFTYDRTDTYSRFKPCVEKYAWLSAKYCVCLE